MIASDETWTVTAQVKPADVRTVARAVDAATHQHRRHIRSKHLDVKMFAPSIGKCLAELARMGVIDPYREGVGRTNLYSVPEDFDADAVCRRLGGEADA